MWKEITLIIALFLACLLVVLLSGCGHNIATASKGVGLRMAWTPDTIMPEVNLGYFEVGSALIRENASFEYKSDSLASLESENADGNIGTQISLVTKQQANGYTTKEESIK